MTRRSYTVIPDWMLDLDLDLWETVILAVIFGFSQDGESVFNGSWNYLRRKAKCSRDKVAKSLRRLEELGYIAKRDIYRDNVHFCQYRFVWRGTQDGPVVRVADGGGTSDGHNNLYEKRDINISGIDTAHARGSFDFAKEIEALGVPAEVVADWMKVRGAKRADNTRTAYEGIVREIRKSGKTAEQCIRFSAEHGWRGFEAAWMEKDEQRRNTRPAAPKQESHMDYYARVMRELHPEEYGGIDNQ